MRYKRLSFILLIILMCGCAGIKYTDQPQSAGVLDLDRTKAKSRVLAKGEEWRNSGVIVEKGKTYAISAKGRWKVGPACKWTGPDGLEFFTLLCWGITRPIVEGWSIGALIGKIGENGVPFAIGNELNMVPQETGALYYRINKTILCGNNAGYADVEIALSDSDRERLAKSEAKPTTKSDLLPIPNLRGAARPNDVAIVIGIENYRSVPKSNYSKSDAETFRGYVKAMGFQDRNIAVMLNEQASLSDVKKTIESWLPNRVRDNSLVLIYYSGHGAPEPATGEAYLVPYDGDPNYLPDTGYSLRKLYEHLGKLKAKEVVVLLDACFSGAGGRSVLAEGARPLVMTAQTTTTAQNMAILTAAQGGQISTSSSEKGHGLFTYYFLKALKEGGKDISEIYENIKPGIEDEAKLLNVQQSPSLSPSPEKIAGKFVLRK